MARCLIIESGIQKYLWTYAVRCSAYIRNRCYNRRLNLTPYEAFTGMRPNISNMNIFGTVCYALNQDKMKLDNRSEKGIFLGYDNKSPAYYVYFQNKQSVRKVRCVKFFQTFECDDGVIIENSNEESVVPKENVLNENVSVPVVPAVFNNQQGSMDSTEKKDVSRKTTAVIKENPRYPERNRSKPSYLNQYDLSSASKSVENFPADSKEYLSDDKLSQVSVDYCYKLEYIPVSYKDAVNCSDSSSWCAAMEEEVSSLLDNNTYDLVVPPPNVNIIKSRWVYAVKCDKNDAEVFKARFVAKGFSQIKDIDYSETFSPTAKITSIRLLMQIAVNENLEIEQMDVKTAYLNADIDQIVYVQQPEGFQKAGIGGENLVCRLNKSLYGLKQSGRNWYHLLHQSLLSQGFVTSFADPCVYSRQNDYIKTIIIIYVDDLLIASNNSHDLKNVKYMLSCNFKMKDLGILSLFLGIQFTFHGSKISMTQQKFLSKLLDRFGMADCKPKLSPCDPSVVKLKEDNEMPLEDQTTYREIVGSLIYVMTSTRPDLCYVVTLLSQFMSRPTQEHLNLAKYVLRYIKHTLTYSLTFTKCDDTQVVGHCDADWGSSSDRRSISGYCYQISTCGTLISWKSKKQPIVALSSCEAEYVALTYAIQEGIFIKQLYFDMFGYPKVPMMVKTDNQSAIALCKNPVSQQRTKHIDIKYHFIRSQLRSDVFLIDYVPSELNIADLFTKPTSRFKLDKFLSVLLGS